MRTVKEINVDIKKLKAELKASYAYERELKAKMAIDYLEANGFKWTGRVWIDSPDSHNDLKINP